MPKLYTTIRNQYASKGVDYDRAQAIAAATFKKLTGRTVQSAMKSAHEGAHSRAEKSAKKRREME